MTAIPSPFQGRCFPDPFPPACASAWGDDPYGLWCEIEVGGVVQRLRWVEPGVFMMGSSEEERGRVAGEISEDFWKRHIGNEGPQHQVTLTRGFWLSDTACTQALWLAVIGGENPSGFDGDLERPVDSVGWDDVNERFLPALQQQLSRGITAVLPTEAEWEYACRAGTKTAYSFGDRFDSTQANVGSKGTMPVKAYPPNPWGFYQMHGNVYEWCSDVARPYGPGSVTDPDGGQNDGGRALRGGAWLGEPWRVRSATRDGLRCESRFDRVGFRFALRPIQDGAAGGMGRSEPVQILPPAEPGLRLDDATRPHPPSGRKPPKAAAKKR
ncbi:MAG TPA: formylglycine-generating enzyme family protein [Zoogloea sp.]|jgi:sulfatase modifying factor 1|nr:formylglycine-generating enzyme family protein [Zoogloea sp.]